MAKRYSWRPTSNDQIWSQRGLVCSYSLAVPRWRGMGLYYWTVRCPTAYVARRMLPSSPVHQPGRNSPRLFLASVIDRDIYKAKL